MRIAAILIALTAFLGCAHDEAAPPMTDPEGFDAAWRDFGAAFDELEIAVRSTPRWETTAVAPARVTGQAEIALDRAERLALWNGSGLISLPAVELIKAEVRRLARIDQEALPQEGADLVVEPRLQRRRFDEERAWHRIAGRIELLEAYAAAGVHSPWLGRQAFPQDLAAIGVLADLEPEDLAYWPRLRVGADDLAELQERAAAVASFLRSAPETR